MQTQVSISPVALASILDGHLRRLESQDRAFGILLGHRSSHGSSRIRVTAALGLPYVITSGNLLQMDFEDLDTDKTINLLQKANASSPANDDQLQIVGWYATSPDLNSYTPLVHDKFATKVAQTAHTSSSATNALQAAFKSASASSTAPQTLHLTLDPETLAFTTYLAAPIGLSGKPQSALFVPVPNELELTPVERPALDMLLANPASTSGIKSQSPINQFAHLLSQVSKMLDTVLAQVTSVLDGSSATSLDPKLASILIDALSHVSLPQTAAEKEKWEEDFEAHLADILMLSYLANLAKYQLDLAARLALLPDKSDFGSRGTA